MIIYGVRNKINNKWYIGQTVRTLALRKSQHICSTSRCPVLKNAFDKYGLENFEWVELATASTLEELNQLEIEYINRYNSIAPNGYNVQTGGNNSKHSEETKQKIGAWRKGRFKGVPLSEEHRQKISAGLKGKSKGKGRIFSEEHKRKIAESRKKTWASRLGNV